MIRCMKLYMLIDILHNFNATFQCLWAVFAMTYPITLAVLLRAKCDSFVLSDLIIAMKIYCK